MDSPWVGLDNFTKFFNSYMFVRVLRNTLWISFYSLLVGFPIPIMFALAINQLNSGWFKRALQMVSYAPNFISTVVVVGMVIQFLDLRRGPINLLLQALGMSPINFMGSPELVLIHLRLVGHLAIYRFQRHYLPGCSQHRGSIAA